MGTLLVAPFPSDLMQDIKQTIVLFDKQVYFGGLEAGDTRGWGWTGDTEDEYEVIMKISMLES